jgi:hypothetical protein
MNRKSLCLLFFWTIFFQEKAFSLIEREKDERGQRIRFLEKVFLEEKGEGLFHGFSSMIWENGFLGFYTLAAAGNLVIYLKGGKESTRFDAAINLLKSSIGAVELAFNPLYSGTDLEDLKKMEDGPDKLKKAEKILEKALEREQEFRKGAWRLTSLTINAIGGLAIWVGSERPVDGILNFLVGVLIGELQIRMAPGRATQEKLRYQNKFRLRSAWWEKVRPYPILNGIGFRMSF